MKICGRNCFMPKRRPRSSKSSRKAKQRPSRDGVGESAERRLGASPNFPGLLELTRLLPMDRQWRERLTDWHHRDRVDIDMRGPGDDPVYGIGDVVGRQRLRSRVDRRGALFVAFE